MPSRSRRSEWRRQENILQKVLIQRNCEYRQCNCTTQELSFQWHRRSPGKSLFRVLKRSPISQPHTLGLRRGYSDGKAVGNMTGDCIRVGEFPCYSHYAERLARQKQVPILKFVARPGRDSNHTNNDLPDMKRALKPLGHTSGNFGIRGNSSAERTAWNAEDSGKSFMYMKNNSGPSTDPWGTPFKMSTEQHCTFSTFTNCLRLVKYEIVVREFL